LCYFQQSRFFGWNFNTCGGSRGGGLGKRHPTRQGWPLVKSFFFLQKKHWLASCLVIGFAHRHAWNNMTLANWCGHAFVAQLGN
jgi:hypothetical protein